MHNNITMKSVGLSNSFVNVNGKKRKHNVKWNANANYDGEKANVSLDIQENKDKKHYDLQLNNDDLEKILNISSIDIPLEKRIKNDFSLNNKHKHLFVYLDDVDDVDDVTNNNIRNVERVIQYGNLENNVNNTNINNIKPNKTRTRKIHNTNTKKQSKKQSTKQSKKYISKTRKNKRRNKKQRIDLINEFGNAIMYR